MKYLKYLTILFFALILFQSCETKNKKKPMEGSANVVKDSIQNKVLFGEVDGQKVYLYTLKNNKGLEVKITNYGGIITSILTPDKNGKFEDIVLGYDSLSGYLNKLTPYFGALIGRYGNRIAKGNFILDGKKYPLVVNNGLNHLHGGTKGFDKVVWNAEGFKTDSAHGLNLTYSSKDMEEGFPGNLTVKVIYSLHNDNSLHIDYEATTDKNTIVNLTNHSYFNLTGNVKRDILDHEVTINADKFLPVDKTLIPTGKLKTVEGTPFDFRKLTPVNKHINDKDEQIAFGGGFDHCWVLNKKNNELSHAASVYEPIGGRKMDVYTTEPAIQFYTGNFLDGKISGKNGINYKNRFALCLETEHFPDSPNQPSFPSVVLKKGDIYKTTTIYTFSK